MPGHQRHAIAGAAAAAGGFWPGPSVSVTGWVTPAGIAFLPFTVSATPAGLPSTRLTGWCSVQRLVAPALMTPWKICLPLDVVSSTQQSSVAVRWITTAFGCAFVTDVAVGFGCALDLCELAPTCCEATGLAGEPDDTTWYTTKPTSSASAATMAALQFGLRRSLILTGVAGSNTSAAVTCGAPCTWSYSGSAAPGQRRRRRAMLRMWPRA